MYCNRLSGLLLLPVLLATSTPAQVTATATVNLGLLNLQAGTLPPVNLSIPPGSALPGYLNRVVTASPNFVVGMLQDGITSTASAVTLTSSWQFVTGQTASGSATSEVLLQVTPAQPVPVMVELEWTLASPAGVALPVVEVDYDNNGSVDLRGQPGTTVRSSMQLGAARQFLLRSVGSMNSSSGYPLLRSNVVLRIVPNYSDVVVFPVLAACSTSVLDVEQTFARGVSIGSTQLASVTPALGLPFLVIGFTPLFAPMPATPLCFLLPNTDIVVPFPRTPLLLDAATLGPRQFFVQGVWIGSSTMPTTTTNGEFVRF